MSRGGSHAFLTCLFLGELQFIFQAHGEFGEEIRKHRAVGLVCAQRFGLMLERGFQFVLGFLDLRAERFGLFEYLGAQIRLGGIKLLLKLRKLLLKRLGIVARFAGELLQAFAALGFFGLQALTERLHLLANVGFQGIEALLEIFTKRLGGFVEAFFEAGEALLVFPHVGTKQNVPDFIDVCAFAQFSVGGVFFIMIGWHGGTAPLSAMNRLPGHAGTLLRQNGVGNIGFCKPVKLRRRRGFGDIYNF